MELRINTSSSNRKENKEKSLKKEKNEFLNKLMECKTTAKSDNKNSDQDKMEESDSLVFDDKINFYEVQKKNMINYMTPIKVNNMKNEKNNNNQMKKNIKSENNISNFDENDELSDLFSNTSTDNKNVMVSELDIELSNSNSNYFTEHKIAKNNINMNAECKSNNINMFKKREIEFKKEIEQNLKKFLKKNQEKNEMKNNNDNNVTISTNDKNDINKNLNKKEKRNHINMKENIKMKRLKKQSHNINYCCLTEINNNKKTKYNNTKTNQNKISSFIAVKNKLNFDYPNHNNTNYNSNNNNSFKNQKGFISKNNASKKYNEIIKINMPKKVINNNNNNNRIIPSKNNNNTNNNRKLNLNYKRQKQMNYTNIYELKSKIFYLQSKIKKNLLANNKKNDLSEYNITHKNNEKKNTLSNFGINSINNTHDDYFNNSEKRKIIYNNSSKKKNKNFDLLNKNDNLHKSLKEKINMNINDNTDDKKIIIQNINCIDYNNINVNINNNIINKPHKFSKLRNNSKKKLSNINNNNNSINTNNTSNNYSNFKKNSTNKNIISKRGKINATKNFCDSYIKNTNKYNTSLNNSKFVAEKNNVFKRMHNDKKLTYKENLDIKNKILNYYLNKKDTSKNKTKYIKVNEIENRKNYNNTINNNLIINEESLSSNKKEPKDQLIKQKTLKCIDNVSFSNIIFNNGKKKFIRQRKEKRNTQVCSNNIKKNLFEYKFIHFK